MINKRSAIQEDWFTPILTKGVVSPPATSRLFLWGRNILNNLHCQGLLAEECDNRCFFACLGPHASDKQSCARYTQSSQNNPW